MADLVFRKMQTGKHRKKEDSKGVWRCMVYVNTTLTSCLRLMGILNNDTKDGFGTGFIDQGTKSLHLAKEW